MSGCVYFVGTEDGDRVKIGMTSDFSPDKRLSALQTASPYKLEILHYIRCDGIDASIVEADLHKAFSAYRKVGEWFENSGLLHQFICDCVSLSCGKAKKCARGGASGWHLLTGEGIPTSPWNVGASRDHTFLGASLAAYNRTGSQLAAENAGLRVLVSEYVKMVTEMSGALDACRHALSMADEQISNVSDMMRAAEYDGGRAAPLAIKIASESDYNQEALSAVEVLFGEDRDFYGDAIFSTEKR